MSTEDQQGAVPLTRRQLREMREAGILPPTESTPVVTSDAVEPAPVVEPVVAPEAAPAPTPAPAAVTDAVETPTTASSPQLDTDGVPLRRRRIRPIPEVDETEDAAAVEAEAVVESVVPEPVVVEAVAEPVIEPVVAEAEPVVEPASADVEAEAEAEAELAEPEAVAEHAAPASAPDVIDILPRSTSAATVVADTPAPVPDVAAADVVEPEPVAADVIEVDAGEPEFAEPEQPAQPVDFAQELAAETLAGGDTETTDAAAEQVHADFGADLLKDESAEVPEFAPSFDDLLAPDPEPELESDPNRLIFTPSPGEASLSGPVASTGEILVTGSYELPRGMASRGHVDGMADGKDVDATLMDGELPAASSPTPIAASSAISTLKPAGEVIRPPAPEKGNRLMVILAITAGGLALLVGAALVIAITTNTI